MKNTLPLLVMLLSCVFFGYLGGIATAHYKFFPYHNIRDAVRTAETLVERNEETLVTDVNIGMVAEATTLDFDAKHQSRWQVLDDSIPRQPILVFGGLNQYLEYCPKHGCLAVLFDEKGNITKSWPYLPEAIYETDMTGEEYPHEYLTFDPIKNTYPVGIQAYENGDLLANFQLVNGAIFPFGMGVARIMPDGNPRWMRFDYSHHWSTLRKDQKAYIPALVIGDNNVTYTLGSEPNPEEFTLECDSGRPQLDIVQVIGQDGEEIENIDLVEIILDSNWTGLLAESTNYCDILHLNFIDVIDEPGESGFNVGDLVLSLRNISRFVILDPVTRTIKRVVGGSFVQQHSVHHLGESRFILFDNHGGDLTGPPSRIIELDLATGVERRVFPNINTPQQYAEIFTSTAGHIDVAPEQDRLLASFTHAGYAFEIEIATGNLIAVYDNLQDVTGIEGIPEEHRSHATRFSIYGMSYAR